MLPYFSENVPSHISVLLFSSPRSICSRHRKLSALEHIYSHECLSFYSSRLNSASSDFAGVLPSYVTKSPGPWWQLTATYHTVFHLSSWYTRSCWHSVVHAAISGPPSLWWPFLFCIFVHYYFFKRCSPNPASREMTLLSKKNQFLVLRNISRSDCSSPVGSVKCTILVLVIMVYSSSLSSDMSFNSIRRRR